MNPDAGGGEPAAARDSLVWRPGMAHLFFFFSFTLPASKTGDDLDFSASAAACFLYLP